ncbi:MAG TPA: hypothetical protein VHZ73_11005 [Vicinamibacterales bacterium]|nr:hypothetical protein [Vicinamibacterales bacterium]
MPRHFVSAAFFFILAALLFLLAIASIAHAEDLSAEPHVRPLMAGIDQFVAEGIKRSPTIRALTEELDRSDVVVYVRARPFNSPLTKAHLLFMTAAGNRRYVLVEIACGETWNTQLAMLGHELRHAVEIADAPWIRSDADLAAHYSRIGTETVMAADHESFETLAAADAGRRVARELATQSSAAR